ncbi:MAG: hypothetical protein WBL21_00575 [Salinimicrobium sp.]
MKKHTLVLLLFFISFHSFAQEFEEELYQRDLAKNEVNLNVLNVLVFGALDLGYERVLDNNTTIGLQLFSKVFNKNEGEDVDLSKVYAKDFSLTSKFKYFFDEQATASGFYALAFGMISDGTNEKTVEITDPGTGKTTKVDKDLDYTDFALGFGVGGKFVAKQGFLLDVSFGLGRNLFNKDSPDIVILPAINVGYRF